MKVLVVEDDVKIAEVLAAYLQNEGYRIETAQDGLAGLEKARLFEPDIILLDVMLPGMDGWEVCKVVRRTSQVPIIMLTARDDEADRVIGLELGADDYVVKPFSPREVIARIKAIMRRIKPVVPTEDSVLRMGDLSLDQASRLLTAAGKPVELTPTEYKLMELFMRHPGQVFSRLQLIESVQDFAYEGYERTLDSHIKNLRKKIGDSSGEPNYIKTVYGVGYKMAGEGHA